MTPNEQIARILLADLHGFYLREDNAVQRANEALRAESPDLVGRRGWEWVINHHHSLAEVLKAYQAEAADAQAKAVALQDRIDTLMGAQWLKDAAPLTERQIELLMAGATRPPPKVWSRSPAQGKA